MMNKEIFGILIDTTGIQEYIFGSNKLKENRGASYLVGAIYEREFFKEPLKGLLEIPIEQFFTLWKDHPEEIRILIDDSVKVEVGYIGGGNAFLLFKEEEKVKQFCKDWSKSLLVKAPGLQTAIAIHKFEDIQNNFKNEFKELCDKLKENKRRFSPITTIPQHGLTANCPLSDLSSEEFDKNEKQYISSYSYAKINHSESQEESFQIFLENREIFPNEMEDLSKEDNNNFIAIIHIDGNNIGSKFENCKSLVDYRKLSIHLDKLFKSSFTTLIKELRKDENELFKKDSRFLLSPIIFGGDDITFISEGNIGIYLAQKYMEILQKNDATITYCAGISIVKQKYPFYRAYTFAEETCNNAKDMRRKKLDTYKGSWIDFHIHYKGYSGTLESIRKKNFTVSAGSLLQRPYKLEIFQKVIDNIKILNQWPSSKIHELREVLWKTESEQKYFIEENKNRGWWKNFGFDKFILESKFKEKIFYGNETPYYDLIELRDFYPKELI